ncbi:MAG: hypothetical protein ABI051_09560 [Vicinamibacterales bacterium]
MLFLRPGTLVVGVAILFLNSTPGYAQQGGPSPVPGAPAVQQVLDQIAQLRSELDAVRRQYDERLSALEQRLQQLTGAPALAAARSAPSAPPSGAAVPPADPLATAAQSADQTGQPLPPNSGRVFNPDTSVIGNLQGAAGKNPLSGQPTMQLSEAEVAFQAVVDPYAKADFFLAAGPEGLEVEEGFVTFTALPHNLLVKAGKMRAQFGKVNTLHTHSMPTVDRPLVIENLLGGEEGLSDSGVSVSHLIDNKLLFLEATGEVYAGTSTVFQSSSRSHLNYVGRLRGYRDLSEDKNLDFGVSYAFGPTSPPGSIAEQGTLNKSLVGVDVTYRYRPLRRAIYSRLNLRSELIWSRQDLPFDTRVSAFGFYGLGEWQFAQRWYAGARFDRSGRVLDGTQKDNGASLFLTFWPSEFSQVRTQFRRTNFAEGVSANELLFQLSFSIGAHGAHLF